MAQQLEHSTQTTGTEFSSCFNLPEPLHTLSLLSFRNCLLFAVCLSPLMWEALEAPLAVQKKEPQAHMSHFSQAGLVWSNLSGVHSIAMCYEKIPAECPEQWWHSSVLVLLAFSLYTCALLAVLQHGCW